MNREPCGISVAAREETTLIHSMNEVAYCRHTSAAVIRVKFIFFEHKLVVCRLYVREIEVRLRDKQTGFVRFNLVAGAMSEGWY